MTQPQPPEDRSIPKAGASSPETKRPTLRRALTRGLITAVACVVAGAVLFGIWGGLFGYRPAAAIYGGAPPGWSGAATVAFMWMVFAGPMVALVGFVVGFLVTPLRSLLSSGQVSKAIGWALLIAGGGFLAFTW